MELNRNLEEGRVNFQSTRFCQEKVILKLVLILNVITKHGNILV